MPRPDDQNPALPNDALGGAHLVTSDDFRQHKTKKAARKQTKAVDITQWALKMFDEVERSTWNHRMRRILKEQESRHFARGQQQNNVDRNTGLYTPILDSPNSRTGEYLLPGQQMMLLTLDHVGPAVKALMKELVASNPRFQANPRNNTNEAAAAARIAQEFIDNDEAINATPDIRQDEALYGLICGNWFKETYYDPTAGGEVEVMDEVTRVTPDKSVYGCANCFSGGDVSDLAGPNGEMPQSRNIDGMNFLNANCPQCGGDVLVQNTIKGTAEKVKTGSHTETVGCPKSSLRDPSGIALKINAKKIADSPFLLEESMIERCVLENAFKWAEIESDPPSAALIAQYQLSRSAGSNSMPAWGGDITFNAWGPFEHIRFRRLWLDYIVYCDTYSDRDIVVGDPDNPTLIIKKGVRLGDLFPDGLCMYRNAQNILVYRNENKNKRWVHCGYIKNIDGLWCDGIVEKIVQPQKRGNVLSSLMMYSATYDSQTQVVLRRPSVDGNKMSNVPGRGLFYLEESFTGDDVTKAFGLIPGRDLTKTVPEERNEMWQEIEYISGAKPGLQGDHDPGTNTYSEAAMERAQQVGMLGPPNELRAFAECERIYQVLAYHKEYPVTGQHKFLGKYQNYELECFYNCDLHRDIEITYAPGSHEPRTTIDVMMAIQAIASFGGQPGGLLNPQNYNPKIAMKIIDAMGNPIDIDDTEPDRRNAQKRLLKLKRFVLTQLPQTGFDITQQKPQQVLPPAQPNAQPQPNPDFVKWQQLVQHTIAQIPFQPETDTHALFIDVYTSEMKTDDLEDGPPFLQDCVLGLLDRHQQIITQNAQQGQQEQMKQRMLVGASDIMKQAMKSDTEIQKAKLSHAQQLENVAMQQAHSRDTQMADQAHETSMQADDQQHEKEVASMLQQNSSGDNSQ